MPTEPSHEPMISDELKALLEQAFDEKAAMVVAAVDAEQKPLVSFRSSLKPFGPRQLAFWARNAEGGTLAAIRAKPQVAVLVRSASIPMLTFAGHARIAEDPAERTRVYEIAPPAEQRADAERKGAAVIIDLDSIEGVMRVGPEGPVFLKTHRR